MADHADVHAADCEARARQRVENSMEQALRGTINGYTSVTPRHQHFHTEGGRVTPVLMPVWLITTQKEGTTYTFAINGQTGKLTCDVPADTKKSLLWGGGVFAGVFALAAGLMAASGMQETPMFFFAALGALLAALITVSVLKGQLKQAGSAYSAGAYAVQESFALFERRDLFLRQTQTRRQIERQPVQNGRTMKH